MNVVDDEIDHLNKSLASNPFVSATYDRLVTLYRIRSDFASASDTYKKKAGLFALSKEEIDEWAQYVDKIDNEELRHQAIQELWVAVTQDYPTVDNWLRRIEAFQRLKSPEELQMEIQLASCLVGSDFKNGKRFWSYVLESVSDNQQKLDVYMSLIQIPHKQSNDTYSELSSFISQNYNGDYEKLMKQASHAFSKTQRKQRYIEPFEIRLHDNESKDIWIEYLQSSAKYSTRDDFQSVETLFARFIAENSLSLDDAIEVWLCYLEIVAKLDGDILETYLMLFVKAFPTHHVPFVTFMQYTSMLKDRIEIFDMVTTRLQLSGILENSSYIAWKSLTTTIISEGYKIVESGHIDGMKTLLENINTYFQEALNREDNTDNCVERICITVIGLLGEISFVKELLMQLLEKFNHRALLWVFAYNLFLTHNMDPHEIFEASVEYLSQMDLPSHFVDLWVTHEQLHGTPQSINNALKWREKALDKMAAVLDKQPPPNKTETSDKVSRSRELYSVKVSNLPLDCTKEDLMSFFKDCGDIKSVLFSTDTSSKTAIVEFSEESQVLASLAKTKKRLKSNTVTVERHLQATLFVSNFPPGMLQEQVQELFASFGPIVSVRFPHQKDNAKARRFCYVEYSTASSATDAILALDNKPLKDPVSGQDYTLKVAHSKPKTKEERRIPMADRKLRVSNLPLHYTVEDISQLFDNLEQVVIPRSVKPRPEGQHNDGVAVLIFQNPQDANKTLSEKNGLVVSDHKLDICKQKHTDSSHRYEENATIGILNVDETLNADQLKAIIVSKEVGTVKHVEIFPSHKASVVEFTNSSDAGKAAMMLQGTQIGNTTVEIVTKAQVMRNITSEQPKEGPRGSFKRLMVPSSVARKKRR